MREKDQHKNRPLSPPPPRDCISDDDVTKGPEGLKLNWVSCARLKKSKQTKLCQERLCIGTVRTTGVVAPIHNLVS